MEPRGDLDAAPAVLRLRVKGAFGRSDLADFRLFAGELSAYHLGRLRQREVPKTLLERELAVIAWGDASDVVVAPVDALAAGTYSLATAELGLLAEVTVDPALVPWLERRWPPPEQRAGRGAMIFCGEGARDVEEGDVLLEPARVLSTVSRGLGGEEALEQDCVRVDPVGVVPDGALLLPPPLVGGVALEPVPLLTAPVPEVASSCEAGEAPVGPSCALVEDDRVRLRAPGAPSFWAMRSPEPRLFVLEPGRSVVLRGLEPEHTTRLSATVFGLDGSSEAVELDLETGAPARHVVINEVLANPVGAERTSEWLELLNDGSEPVELEGFELRDTTLAAKLPGARLDAGELALVVGEGFAPDPELELLAPAGVRRLVVSALGGGGLANAGEPLRLVDARGGVLSRFPALPAPTAGRSVARVAPDAPDDEASSFALHAEPGASPGEPNAVEDAR